MIKKIAICLLVCLLNMGLDTNEIAELKFEMTNAPSAVQANNANLLSWVNGAVELSAPTYTNGTISTSYYYFITAYDTNLVMYTTNTVCIDIPEVTGLLLENAGSYSNRMSFDATSRDLDDIQRGN